MFREIRFDSPEYKAAFRLRDAVLRRPLGYRKQGEPFEEVTIPHVRMEKHCET